MPALLTSIRENRWIACTLIAFLAATIALRAAIASKLGLAPDEAYYWTWSRELSLVYRDHPPFVAYAIAAFSTCISGELGVRFASIAAGAIAVPLTFLVARESGLKAPRALFAACVTSLLPMPSAGALIATPDSFVGLAWLLGGLTLVRLSNGGDPRHWLVFGAATGFGLWAKHSALLLPMAALVTCAASATLRASLRPKAIVAAIALCLVLVSPFIVAEIWRGAPSFSFQIAHLRGGLSRGEPGGVAVIVQRLGELAFGQMGLLTPPIALLFAASFRRRHRASSAINAARIMALAPMAATAIAALGTHPEQNWASLGHPFAVVTAVAVLDERLSKRAVRAWLASLSLVAMGTCLVIHLHALVPFLPLPPERDPVSRLHGYERLGEVARKAPWANAIVCDNYGLASMLEWGLRASDDARPVASLDRARALPEGAWLLLDESGDPGQRCLDGIDCAGVIPLDAFTLSRADGAPLRTIAAYRATGCRQRGVAELVSSRMQTW